MSVKERGVLRKYPSEMTAEEMATWDRLLEERISRNSDAVDRYKDDLNTIQEQYEQAMFAAGLWMFDEPAAPEAVTVECVVWTPTIGAQVVVIETGQEGEVSAIFPDGSCCVMFDDHAVAEPYFRGDELAPVIPDAQEAADDTP